MQNWKYILTHNAVSTTLINPPFGWDQKTISFIRHEFYGSVLRSLSLSLRFIREGRTLLLSAYDDHGINAEVTIQIQYRDPATDTFSDYYTGIIDYSKMRITRDWVEVPIIDNTNVAKLISRDEIEIDVTNLTDIDGGTITEFTGGFAKEANIQGPDISLGALYDDTGIAPEDLPRKAISFTQNFNYTHDYFPTSQPYQVNEIGTDSANIPDDTNFYIFTNNTDGVVTVDYDLELDISGTVDVTNPVNGTVRIKGGCTDDVDFLLWEQTGLNVTNNWTINETATFSFSKNLAAGASIYFKITCSGTDTGPVGSMTFDLVVDHVKILIKRVFFVGVATPVVTNVLLPHETLTRLLQKITGATVTLDASIIGRTDSEPDTYGSDGAYSLMSIASGYMLRDFPLANKPVNFTLRDWFRSYSSIAPIGLWYDETADEWQLYSLDQFYKNSEVISLGEVAEFERFIDEKYFYNSLQCGYEDVPSHEEDGSRLVIHDTKEFSNNIVLVKNIKSFLSSFKADDYSITFLQRNLYVSDPGADTRYDKGIYFVTLQRNGADIESITGYDNFSELDGVLNKAERLNLDITPVRNLNRHLQEVATAYYLMSGTKTLRFHKSDFNIDFSSKKVAGSTIGELDNLTISTQPLYHPEVYNFRAPVTAAQITSLLADPHGYVTFTYQGTTYKGYILEVSTEPFNRKGNWTLIKTNPSR